MENNLLGVKKKEFGLYESALATILFIVFNFAFSFIYSMIPVRIRRIDAVYFVASFVLESLFAVVAYIVAVTRKVDFVKAVGADKKINFNCVFYAILISFASLAFFGNLTNVFLEFLGICGYSSILGSLEIPNFGVYLIYVVVSCVVPAVCEDILFRGVIASGLKEKGFKVALFGSALIFTFMHGNPEQTVHQFIIGLIVGYIFLKTGNVWLGIIVHFVNNFVAVTMAFISGLMSKGEPVVESVEAVAEVSMSNKIGVLLSSLIIALILAFIGYLVIKRLTSRIIHESDLINNPQNNAQETATIKVDNSEVLVQMTVDGKVVEENSQSQGSNEKKVKEAIPIPVVIMFILAGAYFAIEWLSSLISGFGLF